VKKFSPGADKNSDYIHICDCCEVDDGRSILLWDGLPGRRGHFALYKECISKLYHEYKCGVVSTGIPTTIMVNRMVIPESLRNEVFDRDDNKCVKCGTTENLQIDHMIPFSKGGKTIKSNLQTLCKSCNLGKRDNRG